MALKNPRADTPVRRQSVTLKSEDPIVRTAKLVQNRAGYFEIVYSEPRGGKGLGWRSRTLSTRTQNRAEAQRELDHFIDGAIRKSQPTVTQDQLTVEDICRDYLVARPQQRYPLMAVRAQLGHVRVGDLTPDLCRRYCMAFGTVKNDTLRRRLGALKGAINHARRNGKINVAPYIDLPPPGAPRVRWLTREQLALVRDRALEQARLNPGPVTHALKVFVFLASTFGARREAIWELSWDRVDFDHRTIDFRNPTRVETKKRRAVVHLSDEALLFLREVHLAAGRPCNGRLIPVSFWTLNNAYHKFCVTIGMGWCTSHVFRHTLATHLLQDGKSIYHVAQVLADSVSTIEKTYAHVVPADLAQVMEGRKLGW